MSSTSHIWCFMRGAGVLAAGLCVVFDVALLAEALIS